MQLMWDSDNNSSSGIRVEDCESRDLGPISSLNTSAPARSP